MWTSQDAHLSRSATCRLVALGEEGAVDWEVLAKSLMGWLSDSEVRDFANQHNFFNEECDEEDED